MQYEYLFHIEIYSHFFKVTKPTPRARQMLLKFCSKYVHVGFAKENKNNRGEKEATPFKVYASKVRDSSEFRLHIGQMEDFLKTLEYNFITPDMYTVVNKALYVPTAIKIALDKRFTLYDYQVECRSFVIEESPDDNRSRLVALPTGKGKMQPLDALIKVPGGWSTMGEMKVGTVITAKDGSPTVVTGVYPNGVKDIFKITFRDGRSTECGAEHLWKVFCPDWRDSGWKILSTKDILNLGGFKRDRVYIDLIDPEDCPDVDVPIDPYLLGLFLGDGGIANSSLTFTKGDEFILEEIRGKLTEEIELKHRSRYTYSVSRKCLTDGSTNTLLTAFKKAELCGKIHYQKFIPEMYLHGSIKQRLALLQGLMDTDGTAEKTGSANFSSASKQLAEGVQYLVRSLGGMASISHKRPHFTYKGEKREGRLSYRVNIRYKRPSDLFRLPRKKARVKYSNQYSETLKLRIETIEHVGKKEAQCISVSHPERLYVTDEFIVTHNTLLALASMADIGQRFAVVVLKKYMQKWAGDITGTVDIKPKEIMLINGSGQLKGLIELGKEGKYSSKAVIISLSTIKNFFKAYEEDPYSIEDLYGCKPEELFGILGIGSVIVDEAHEHIHAVYNLMLYSHVPKFIALTATLISNDPFISRMHHLMFPREIRYDKIKMNKYIKVYAIAYHFRNLSAARIRTNEFGSNTYSHHAFERSILKNKDPSVLENYLILIDYLIDLGYVSQYKEGDRLVIFAAGIEMCTVITEHIKQRFPKYDTRRYVEDDPYENAIEADIRVSTIQSCGTALDIPLLRAAIMTTSISSPVSNRQALGRLRELKDRDVKFFYIYCEQLRKQVQYHKEKKELFQNDVASIKEFLHPVMV